MLREEAEKEAQRMNKIPPKWKCPLNNLQPCDIDCISYVHAKTRTITHHCPDTYIVDEPYCQNHLINPKENAHHHIGQYYE